MQIQIRMVVNNFHKQKTVMDNQKSERSKLINRIVGMQKAGDTRTAELSQKSSFFLKLLNKPGLTRKEKKKRTTHTKEKTIHTITICVQFQAYQNRDVQISDQASAEALQPWQTKTQSGTQKVCVCVCVLLVVNEFKRNIIKISLESNVYCFFSEQKRMNVQTNNLDLLKAIILAPNVSQRAGERK